MTKSKSILIPFLLAANPDNQPIDSKKMNLYGNFTRNEHDNSKRKKKNKQSRHSRQINRKGK